MPLLGPWASGAWGARLLPPRGAGALRPAAHGTAEAQLPLAARCPPAAALPTRCRRARPPPASAAAAGACKEAIKQSCHALKPGAGRLAACLTRRQRAAESAERDGAEALGPGPLREAALGEACAKELDAFRVDAATNINKNVPLGGWVRLAGACSRGHSGRAPRSAGAFWCRF